MNLPRLVIAAPSGSSGKTTLTLGLLSALSKKGFNVQPFKVGADFIDPQLHQSVTHKPSYNLDTWLLDDLTVKYLFQEHASSKISIVEGVCGLFDSAAPDTEQGSTAHLAKVLKAPVILLVNAIGSFRSLAAEVHGFSTFDPGVNVAGVILNNIGSNTHYQWTKQIIESSTKIPVLGFLPYDPRLILPERHLGLIPTKERHLPGNFISVLTDLIEANIDIEQLLKIANAAPQLSKVKMKLPKSPKTISVAVARDEAFNFYYQDNLEILQQLGATISYFSPLKDKTIPDVDLVYIGGGFPEVFAQKLSKNLAMINSLRAHVKKGKRIYGECGGLMYLSRSITTKDNQTFKMVGIIPWSTRWSDRLKISFLESKAIKDNMLCKKGQVYRGQEFHMFESDELKESEDQAWEVVTHPGRQEGYAKDNILASFIHRHFWSHPEMALNLLGYSKVLQK